MNAAKPPAYPYRRLGPQSIRLLRILPGVDHHTVRCSLEEADVRRPAHYEALSYCWGDAKDKLTISCNGLPFEVTRSLHSALIRLRLANQARLIWADAICINQNDTSERSAQVLLMQAIYQRALSVVIWLGGPVEVDGKDLWSIPDLLEASQKKLKRTQLPIRHGTNDWVKFVLSNDWTTTGDLQDKKWNAIIKSLILMLQRPWFLRTWIIQEVALARRAEVLCGQHATSWDDFYKAVSYAIDLDYFSNTAPEMYSSLRRIETARRDTMQRRTQRPLDLLGSFRIFQATDPRDKVFGLYSLFSESDLARLTLRPNYDMDIVDVYAQAVIDCIASEGNLDVLGFAGMGDDEAASCDLPSWVPDWTSQDRAQPLLPRFLQNQSFGDHAWPATWWSATGRSYPAVEVSKDGKSISLSGCLWDRVVETGGVLEKAYFEGEIQPGHAMLEVLSMLKKGCGILKKWEEMCGVLEGRVYCTGESAEDVFWKTLHGGCLPYGDEQHTKAAFYTWYRPFRDTTGLVSCAENCRKDVEKLSTAYKVAAWMATMGKVWYKGTRMGLGMLRHTKEQSRMLGMHRTLIRTGRGYVGLTSRFVREGDYVAFFEGGKMPLVMREDKKGGDGWRLMGDAYVHGVMDGELFERFPCVMLKLV
ncbi:hypothetical protein S40288_07030 [Stachybotrys chartarum IBT 40288]|nr:hypothetical protein S40288_07030 [Stachybotrys chartarum IBT 40288]